MKIYRAQTLVEYSICLTVVLIVAVTMSVYSRRGLQARYADITDFTTAKVSGSTMKQYEPYYASQNFIIGQDRKFGLGYQGGGALQTNMTNDSQDRSGSSEQDINCYDD